MASNNARKLSAMGKKLQKEAAMATSAKDAERMHELARIMAQPGV